MALFRRSKGGKEQPISPQEPQADPYADVANAYLPVDVARRWLGLAKPAVRLTPATVETEVIAHLGGIPLLPPDQAWPVWEGHGPLSYIGGIDLAAVDRREFSLTVDLPKDGWLLGFYFDGSFDNYASTVGTWDRQTLAGAQLIHVEAPDNLEPCPAPAGVTVYERQDLKGIQFTTFPGWEHPVLEAEFRGDGLDHRAWMDHPVNDDAFNEAVRELAPLGAQHQLGGWADPIQGPVELEVAQAELGDGFKYGGQTHTRESLMWQLLWQVDSDERSRMMWGDVGILYWLQRNRPDADSASLGNVSFTWQCG